MLTIRIFGFNLQNISSLLLLLELWGHFLLSKKEECACSGRCVFLTDSQASRGDEAQEWPKCGLQAADKGKSVSIGTEY